MISIHCTVTESEYLEAQKLFLREQTLKSRWWRWSMSVLCLTSALVVVSRLPQPLQFGDIPPYTFSLVVIAAIPLWLPALQRRAFKKRFAKEKVNLTEAHITLDESGYRCEVPGVGSGIAEWTGMSDWLEGKSVFMIRSGYLMRIVPKKSLDDNQLDEVRRTLTEYVVSSQRR